MAKHNKRNKNKNRKAKNGEGSKLNQGPVEDPASKMVLNEKGELDYVVTQDEYWDQLELLEKKEKELGVSHRTRFYPVSGLLWDCDDMVCHVYSDKNADPNSISERIWRILGPPDDSKGPLPADFKDPFEELAELLIRN